MLISVVLVFASGGYDHGTSTGKGQLELDFTWNPFDIIKYGQSYIVFGYGLTDRLDIHGYYSHITYEDQYYYGLFYQFADTKYLDLATAIGGRQYTIRRHIKDLFFPQLLYNIKFLKDFTVGGALVNVLRNIDNKFQYHETALDIALYIPLSGVVKLPKYVHEIKIALGIINVDMLEGLEDFHPTYSVDVTFKNFFKKKEK